MSKAIHSFYGNDYGSVVAAKSTITLSFYIIIHISINRVVSYKSRSLRVSLVPVDKSNLWQLGNTIRFTTTKLIPVISLKLVLSLEWISEFQPRLALKCL